jgi:hypothetical protein
MCIYTGNSPDPARDDMKKTLERHLDPRKFRSAPQSSIDQVRTSRLSHARSECFLVLDSGAEVKVSRSFAWDVVLARPLMRPCIGSVLILHKKIYAAGTWAEQSYLTAIRVERSLADMWASR